MIAVCCSVLQCVAVCCSVLQCIAVCCSVLQCVAAQCRVLPCVSVVSHYYGSVLQCAVVCLGHFTAACSGMLQRESVVSRVYSNLLQSVAV